MKMYVEVDNRLIKEDKKVKDKSSKDNKEKNNTIAESYGLSKNARILTE